MPDVEVVETCRRFRQNRMWRKKPMKTLRKITSALFCGVLCVIGTGWAFAAPWMPEEPSKDEAALVGFYQGNGESLAVRENAGQLEILYRYQPKDKDFTKSNVFTLVKNYYDNYELREIGPNTDATSTLRFDRDKNGQGISLNMGQKSYTRRFGGENGKPMRITPPKPMEELRKEAESAQPPRTCLSENGPAGGNHKRSSRHRV